MHSQFSFPPRYLSTLFPYLLLFIFYGIYFRTTGIIIIRARDANTDIRRGGMARSKPGGRPPFLPEFFLSILNLIERIGMCFFPYYFGLWKH